MATIVKSKSHKTQSYKIPGFALTNHYFKVPLRYDKPDDRQITVFAREIVSIENAAKENLPWLLFLEGGPGGHPPRPDGKAGTQGWLTAALKAHRVLILDQRGTGLSSQVSIETLAAVDNAKSQAEYLTHFRADNIIRDCEAIRMVLTGGQPWTVLAQSYGGFCLATYLSFFPSGLKEAIFTGGLPPFINNPDAAYESTYKHVINKNKLYYRRYPEDGALVRKIVNHLSANKVALTTGETLTPHRFLQIGICLGYSGCANAFHYMFEEAFLEGAPSKLCYRFLRAVEEMTNFNTNLIYSILHEACYCQAEASNWSAQRILPQFREFDLEHEPPYFTGEMIYPWMFDEYHCLKPFKEAAEILAHQVDWPPLYDLGALRKNNVPTAAIVYHDDMYVDKDFSQRTAAEINGLKLWITNQYEHDGIRGSAGVEIVERLLSMVQAPA